MSEQVEIGLDEEGVICRSAIRRVLEGLFGDYRGDRQITLSETSDVPAVALKGDIDSAMKLREHLSESFDASDGSSLIEFKLDVSDEQLRLHCRTRGYVGFQGFPKIPEVDRQGEGWLQDIDILRIKPKVEEARWLSLISLAQGWDDGKLKWLDEPGLVSSERGMEWQLAELYRLALQRLFENYGGLRQLHTRRREVLRNRLKGRLEVSSFMKNIMGGRVDRVPCEYSALRVDCWPNRMLLAALQVARRLKQRGPEHPLGVERAGRSLGELESSFGGVQAGAFDMSQEGRGRLPEVFRGYQEQASMALPIARLLLQHAKLDDQAGRFRVDGFQVDMSWFYEQAFARLVEREVSADPMYQGSVSQHVWGYEASDEAAHQSLKDGRFEPDIYVRPRPTEDDEDGAPAVVIDMKWKSILESDEVGEKLKKAGFSNPDLYQIATYAQVAPHVEGAQSHRKRRSVVGVLVYPTKVENPDKSLSQIKLKTGGGQSLPLWVAGWNVASDPAASGRELWKAIQALG